ncbi:recombinase family protein [Companilactobacillus sp. RD055328]|uniref:recombinase family protein n=1 Tax=Companilactobacillus sp. RD055328 TaxID=2916634 RepID=UPI0020880452|nr:recombinase family protein [Companilactobacillus sp. RD055328]
MKTVSYCRTSTNRQDLGLDVQIKAMENYNPQIIFKEQVSGRKEEREELIKALSVLEKGDTLLIYKLDRLSRSTKQLVNLMAELNDEGVHLVSISDGIDTSTANGRFLFTIMSAMSQLEAELISQRTKEALAVTDKKLGRPAIKEKKTQKILDEYQNSNLMVKDIAEKEGVSTSFIYKLAKKHGCTRR